MRWGNSTVKATVLEAIAQPPGTYLSEALVEHMELNMPPATSYTELAITAPAVTYLTVPDSPYNMVLFY